MIRKKYPRRRSVEPVEDAEHDLIARINAFLALSGECKTSFGRAFGDEKLVSELYAGRRLKPPTRLRVERYLSNGVKIIEKRIATLKRGLHG
jgi:hypothetical protein